MPHKAKSAGHRSPAQKYQAIDYIGFLWTKISSKSPPMERFAKRNRDQEFECLSFSAASGAGHPIVSSANIPSEHAL
jgi:hypothetical protein